MRSLCLLPAWPSATVRRQVDEATSTRARDLLRDALGAEAEFREGQLEAILALVDHRVRVLVVQRTGWGKSVVYFIATKLLRERGAGPTILISPLLSLIRDQLNAAGRLGLRSASIDSTNPDQWGEIEAALRTTRSTFCSSRQSGSATSASER